jgi:hypothetical protein
MIHIVLSAKHSLELGDNEFGCFCEVLVGVSETHNFRAVLAETNLQSQAQSFDIFERIGGVLLKVAPRTVSFISCQEWLRRKPEETFHALHALSRLTSVPVLSFLEPGIFPLLTQLFPNHKDVPVHFVGSVAFHFSDLLKEACKIHRLNVGVITREPVINLVEYHLNKVQSTV